MKLMLAKKKACGQLWKIIVANIPWIQVLCNNPKKYAVVEPEGRISGQKCVDIVIRSVFRSSGQSLGRQVS